MTTYLSFTQKQGILVNSGGPWVCLGFNGPCLQDGSGPIATTSTPSGDGSFMTLAAQITLGDNEFKGAKTLPTTISYNVQATAQGGSPDPFTIQSKVGGAVSSGVSVQYNSANPTFATYSTTLSSRPNQIPLEIDTSTMRLNGATVTVTISDLTFVIHDVVYSTTSAVGSSSTSAVSSVSSSTSKPASSSTLSTNSTASLTRSASLTTTAFTTTISGHGIVIAYTIPEPSSSSGSQSHPPSSSNTPGSTSMTVSELAGIIVSILVGLALILIAIAMWYRWWRRRRMTPSEENRRKSYIQAIIKDEVVVPAEAEKVDNVELEMQDVFRYSLHRHERAPSYQVSSPPPAYSQLSPRSTSRSISPSTDD